MTRSMTDWDRDQWIKSLATASLRGNAWHIDHPGTIQQAALHMVLDTIEELQEEAQRAAEVFNMHCTPAQQMRVLALSSTTAPGGAGASPRGFVLLQGRHQNKVTFSPGRLEALLIIARGFTHEAINQRVFLPRVDGLGSVFWQMDQGPILTNVMIVKQVFEDLHRATLLAAGAR